MTQGKAGGVVGYFIVRCPKRSFSFSIDFLNTFLSIGGWAVLHVDANPARMGHPKMFFGN